jgi:hypothetical protein
MPSFWPYPPQSLSETLQFYTDVRGARASETRDSLKDATRMMDISHTLPFRDAEEALELFRSDPLGEWVVPVWPEFSHGGALILGATTITCDTDASYKVGGYVYIGDGVLSEFRVVQSIGSGSIVITAGTSRAYTAPMIAPAEQCYAPGGIQTARGFPLIDLAVQWMSLEPADQSDNPFVTHGGFPVVTDPGVLTAPLSGNLSRALQVLDSRFGAYALAETETYTRRRSTLQFMDQSGRWSRRQFLHYCRGQDQAFYVPTWQNDLPLQASVSSGDTTIQVKKLTPTAAQLVGRVIQIENAGVLYHRTITAATTLLDVTTLTVASGITAGTDAVVSLMTLYRFETDSLTLSHMFTANGLLTSFGAPLVETLA